MAITGHLENLPETAGMMREPRRKLRLEAQGVMLSGDETDVMIHNVSTTGLLLESQVSLVVGEAIDIDLPQAGATRAKVIWTSGNLFGCEFDAPISSATLSAAELRSPAIDLAEPVLREHTLHDEAFSVRLQRLRKERRLTLSAIATQLGVSKPTVWAWEQGRARPVDSRLDALAEALGVAKSELVPEGGTSLANDLITRSKENIAAALGTTPEKVRILVEL